MLFPLNCNYSSTKTNRSLQPAPYTYLDRTLLSQIADGDETAFTAFFEAAAPQVRLWAGSILHDTEAEKEILQEVFVRIWMHRDQLPGLEFPQAWMKKMTVNKSLTWLQATARRELHERRSQSGELTIVPEDTLSYQELTQLLNDAVDSLPPQRRQIYLLSREQGLKPAEIAEQLNLSPGTVRNATSQALAEIRTYLKASGRYIPLFLLFLK